MDFKNAKSVDVASCKSLVDDRSGMEGLRYVPDYYYPNWIKVDGKWFFKKDSLDYFQLAAELVGSYLAKFFKLPTVDYQICFDGNNYSLMSLNHMHDGLQYVNGIDLANLGFSLEQFLKFILEKYDVDLQYDLFKVCILDYLMSQSDRHFSNLLFIKDDGKLYLDMVFDYACSFNCLKDILKTDFYTCDSNAIISFVKQNSNMMNYINDMLEVNICSILNDVESQFGIVVDSDIKDQVSYYFEKKKEFLRRR